MAIRKIYNAVFFTVLVLSASAIFVGCGGRKGKMQGAMGGDQGPQALTVMTIAASDAVIPEEYTGNLQGKMDVDIHPQVTGYITGIYVNEGQFVHKGQPLFKIDDRTYKESLSSAKATLASAEASILSAKIEIQKIKPLVQNQVVSNLQLQTAQATLKSSEALAQQAIATIRTAEINIGYTLIKAPINGYLSKITYKMGALVSAGTTQTLVTISDVSQMFFYFTMSEVQLENLKSFYPGNSLQERINNIPPVTLELANNTDFPIKGKIKAVMGLFDQTTGSISLKAVFDNKNGELRSGNTGKIRIEKTYHSAIQIPVSATTSIQDRVFAYVLKPGNKVVKTLLTIQATNDNVYLISGGLNVGDKIVLNGLDKLKDGDTIKPVPYTPANNNPGGGLPNP